MSHEPGCCFCGGELRAKGELRECVACGTLIEIRSVLPVGGEPAPIQWRPHSWFRQHYRALRRRE